MLSCVSNFCGMLVFLTGVRSRTLAGNVLFCKYWCFLVFNVKRCFIINISVAVDVGV